MSGAAALLIDFGSTYTKLRAVDLETGHLLGAGQGPSTVASDVTVGMDAALADLEAHLGGLPAFRHRLASSSAAGGLKMVTVGLVKELTAEAARLAALGAGAKLTATYAYKLTRGDVAAIEAAAPDILLLAGGTDGGNTETLLHNAAALADSSIDCPVVVAGNRNAADAAADRLGAAGKPVVVTSNVMPAFNEVDIEPARAEIRHVFIDRIVHAKGIDRAAERFDAVLMPTPAAVLEGAKLLAEGTGDVPGLGEIVVVDVGGATTDVHSVADGRPSGEGVIQTGLPEPRLKRTVEGDLGMRHNARAVVEAAGLHAIAESSGLDAAEIDRLLGKIEADVERLPSSSAEAQFDTALAEAAVGVAVTRHAGTVRIQQTVTGPVAVQTGKDLSDVACVIGTGGVLVHGRDPAAVLAAALANPAAPEALKPKAPKLLVDRDYLLFAVGLLAEADRDAAARLGRTALDELTRENDDGRRIGNG